MRYPFFERFTLKRPFASQLCNTSIDTPSSSAASLRLRKRTARPASGTASPASNRSAICAASSAFRDSSDSSAEFMRFSVLACACCSHNTDSIFPKAVLKNLRPKSATSNEELNKMFIVEAAIAVFEPTRGCDKPLLLIHAHRIRMHAHYARNLPCAVLHRAPFLTLNLCCVSSQAAAAFFPQVSATYVFPSSPYRASPPNAKNAALANGVKNHGGDEGARTLDPHVANVVLSQHECLR